MFADKLTNSCVPFAETLTNSCVPFADTLTNSCVPFAYTLIVLAVVPLNRLTIDWVNGAN